MQSEFATPKTKSAPRSGGGVWYILWGVAGIVGGASGKFVLRGTNSRTSLIVAGCAFVLWGIFRLASKG